MHTLSTIFKVLNAIASKACSSSRGCRPEPVFSSNLNRPVNYAADFAAPSPAMKYAIPALAALALLNACNKPPEPPVAACRTQPVTVAPVEQRELV